MKPTLIPRLNAARNIGVLSKSEYLRLFVNEPIVASDDALPAGGADGSCKPPTDLVVVDKSLVMRVALDASAI